MRQAARLLASVVVHYLVWWHLALLLVGAVDGALSLSLESAQDFFVEYYLPSFEYIFFRRGREIITLTQFGAVAGTIASVLLVETSRRRRSRESPELSRLDS